MSDEKNAGEARRRLLTARGDLETARVLTSGRRWAHACFHAHQAAELDRYCRPTRYPNGLPDLTPDQVFTRAMAENAVNLAASIVDRIAPRID